LIIFASQNSLKKHHDIETPRMGIDIKL
jgi:hypothetical protein